MISENAEPFPTRITEVTFRTLYQQYWERVYAVCYSNLREPEIAKGMVQDIFKSLWERKDELEITQSPERYLSRAAKQKVMEHLRNKRIRRQHLELLGAATAVSSNGTEEQVLFTSLSEQLAVLVNTLPTQCRRVFRMSREQGLSNREIAGRLLISERAVEYHISKALRVLRAGLPGYSL